MVDESDRDDETLLTSDFFQDLNCFWDLQDIDRFPQMCRPIQPENHFLPQKETRASKKDARYRA